MPAGRFLRILKPFAAAALAIALPLAALAQSPVRVIPDDAPAAKLVVAELGTAPQQVSLDGRTIGVAPGLRLFGEDNLLVNPVSVAGKKLPVRYKLDTYGQLLTAWVLTEAEQRALKAAK